MLVLWRQICKRHYVCNLLHAIKEEEEKKKKKKLEQIWFIDTFAKYNFLFDILMMLWPSNRVMVIGSSVALQSSGGISNYVKNIQC